eukprot:11976169-Alexandrium_andersonii.AAC.1
MEALLAFCSEEFQSIRSSQTQHTATAENLKAEVLASTQKLQGLDVHHHPAAAEPQPSDQRSRNP